jgi:transcription initiation factor TFIID TATA-box-binding protein
LISIGVEKINFLDTEYHPEQFPRLVFRIKSPKTATLVFSSGKMVCTGAKSEEEAIKAVHHLHTMLEEKELMIYE